MTIRKWITSSRIMKIFTPLFFWLVCLFSQQIFSEYFYYAKASFWLLHAPSTTFLLANWTAAFFWMTWLMLQHEPIKLKLIDWPVWSRGIDWLASLQREDFSRSVSLYIPISTMDQNMWNAFFDIQMYHMSDWFSWFYRTLLFTYFP